MFNPASLANNKKNSKFEIRKPKVEPEVIKNEELKGEIRNSKSEEPNIDIVDQQKLETRNSELAIEDPELTAQSPEQEEVGDENQLGIKNEELENKNLNPLNQQELKTEVDSVDQLDLPTGNSQFAADIQDLEDSQPKAQGSQPAVSSLTDNLDLNDELKQLKEKVDNANLPPDLKIRVDSMIVRLSKMTQEGNYSKEYEPVSEYVNWITKIPWGVKTTDNLNLDDVKTELIRHHYGLEPVKQRLMEYLAIMKLRNSEKQAATNEEMSSQMSRLQGSSSHAPVLCFVGIQGVGKTSIAKSISAALERKFIRIALGAVGSVTEIRGRSRGELDAEPGQIVKALIRSGSMNPVILLDEVDKTSSSTGLRADVMAALLEILDPEQNSTFLDKYIDFPIDLSGVFFITTANNLGGISAALLDRLEIIRFGSYTDSDKVQIAKNYLLPKVREATGLTEKQLSFDDDIWEMVVRPLGFDAGVRQLERTLEELARKVALQIVQGTAKEIRLNKDNFRQYIPEDIGVYS